MILIWALAKDNRTHRLFQQLALLLPSVAFKLGNYDMMICLPNLQLFLKGYTLSVLKSWQPASDPCESESISIHSSLEGCFASLWKNFQILGSQSYRVEFILFSQMQKSYGCHTFQYCGHRDCSPETFAVEVVFFFFLPSIFLSFFIYF